MERADSSDCDIYWGLLRDADKDKLNRMDRLEVNNSEDNL